MQWKRISSVVFVASTSESCLAQRFVYIILQRCYQKFNDCSSFCPMCKIRLLQLQKSQEPLLFFKLSIHYALDKMLAKSQSVRRLCSQVRQMEAMVFFTTLQIQLFNYYVDLKDKFWFGRATFLRQQLLNSIFFILISSLWRESSQITDVQLSKNPLQQLNIPSKGNPKTLQLLEVFSQATKIYLLYPTQGGSLC